MARLGEVEAIGVARDLVVDGGLVLAHLQGDKAQLDLVARRVLRPALEARLGEVLHDAPVLDQLVGDGRAEDLGAAVGVEEGEEVAARGLAGLGEGARLLGGGGHHQQAAGGS